MLISENGGIVLIDDKREEIESVLTTLGRYGIPYIYLDGTQPTLPQKPMRGIRFVFLDIELRGMEGQQPKTKASGVVGILKKIIAEDNGPYVIGFWTRHKEVIPHVLENCEKQRIPPVTYVDLEKLADIGGITERLREKLGQIGAFQLYVSWENVVNAASKEFVRSFSSLANLGTEWSSDTAALFHKLYKTYVDKHDLQNKEEQFRCACHLMNRSFLDTLENLTRRQLNLPEGFRLERKAISGETIAKLNTSLFLRESITSRHSPGNIYLHHDDALKGSLIQENYRQGQTPAPCELCMVIISPECDLAQNKVMRAMGGDGTPYPLHRVLFGLKVLSGEADKLRDRRDCDYGIGPVWHGNKSNTLLFHFATMSFRSEDEMPEPPLFTLQRDLLFDLQSKAANHVNRLGNYLLKQ
jgi:hypothetical protein